MLYLITCISTNYLDVKYLSSFSYTTNHSEPHSSIFLAEYRAENILRAAFALDTLYVCGENLLLTPAWTNLRFPKELATLRTEHSSQTFTFTICICECLLEYHWGSRDYLAAV